MLGALLVGALIISWTAATPVFSLSPLQSAETKEKTQVGKSVPLTDLELDSFIGGEPASCMPDAKAEQCILRGPEGLTDIIFWDEWRIRGPVRTSEVFQGGFVQSNTTGTAQFNSTMAK